jgi:hypothetical protein
MPSTTPNQRRNDDAGPIPEDNVAGHHPEQEQDKPKVRIAAVPKGVRGADPTPAGDALRAAAGAVRKVRESLPR